MALGTWMFSRNLVGKPKGLEVSIKADTAFHQSGMKHIYLPNKSSWVKTNIPLPITRLVLYDKPQRKLRADATAGVYSCSKH